jgi:hypothetical protein
MSVYGTELAQPALRPKGGYFGRKRTLGSPRQSGAPQGPRQGARAGATDGPSGGVADSPDKAKARFRAAWERPPVTVPSWGAGPDAGWLGESDDRSNAINTLLARRDGLTRALVGDGFGEVEPQRHAAE